MSDNTKDRYAELEDSAEPGHTRTDLQRRELAELKRLRQSPPAASSPLEAAPRDEYSASMEQMKAMVRQVADEANSTSQDPEGELLAAIQSLITEIENQRSTVSRLSEENERLRKFRAVVDRWANHPETWTSDGEVARALSEVANV